MDPSRKIGMCLCGGTSSVIEGFLLRSHTRAFFFINPLFSQASSTSSLIPRSHKPHSHSAFSGQYFLNDKWKLCASKDNSRDGYGDTEKLWASQDNSRDGYGDTEKDNSRDGCGDTGKLWAPKDNSRDGYGDTEMDIAAALEDQRDLPDIWQGAKPLPLAISLGVGIAVLLCLPKPASLSTQAWQLLSIFLTTITGLVLGPLPVGAWAFLTLTISVASGTLPFSAAFGAFTNEIIWLIVISFFFAKGFVKTGLGDRIATLFVKVMGASTLGLSYGLIVSEALISPAMPSTTARAGGVFLPVIQSLSMSAGSLPNDQSSEKMGSFLVQCQFQAAGHSSALFLTGAAQNLLCIKLAEELGVRFVNPWVEWFEAASIPGLVALLATPLMLYTISPPALKYTPNAPAMAGKKLQEMGPLTSSEWIMIVTMLLAVVLWVFGDQLGISSVVTAMLGLSILLLLGVLDWDDCLSEKAAWDTLVWFGVLVGMASQLSSLGIVQWVADSVDKVLLSLSLGWPVTFVILQACYFIMHYLFASQTAHVGALYSAFLAMHIVAGVPHVLAALALGYNTSLFGGLAHYSSGQAAVYCGAGYVELPQIFRTGLICGLLNCLIWGIVGAAWWKFLGLY